MNCETVYHDHDYEHIYVLKVSITCNYSCCTIVFFLFPCRTSDSSSDTESGTGTDSENDQPNKHIKALKCKEVPDKNGDFFCSYAIVLALYFKWSLMIVVC